MNLSDAITAFLIDRKAKGVTAKSVRNDKGVLQYLLADIGNIQVHAIKPQHLDVFWSKRTTWGPGTMNRGRTCLNTFFDWCRTRGYLPRDSDPMDGVRRLKVPPRDRVTIPQGEFQTLIEGQADPRRRIVVALSLYLFLRRSEIEILRWQDINLETGVAQIFRPKTQTMDDLPICEELHHELRRWRRAYGVKMGEPPMPNWFLVPALQSPQRNGVKGHKGFSASKYDPVWLPTTKPNLQWVQREVLKDAGYYRPHEGGHTFRRSGAIALYNELSRLGHDRAIRICQAMLGHSSVQTTEIYLRLDLDRKVRNDLLAGKPMFNQEVGEVIPIQREAVDGRENTQSVRV